MSDDRRSKKDVESSSGGESSSSGGCDRTGEERLSVDGLHRLLASSRRRQLLSYLTARSGDSVPVDELVDAIVERERPDPGPETHRSRVEMDLRHIHLPKLADPGVVCYDPVAETVRYEEREALETLLETSNAVEKRR